MTPLLVMLGFGGFVAFIIWCCTDKGEEYFNRKLKPWRPVGRYLLADLRAILRPRRRQPVEVPDYIPEDWGS
jgi:hypothetical protein